MAATENAVSQTATKKTVEQPQAQRPLPRRKPECMRCGNCIYYACSSPLDIQDLIESQDGICRRYPPRLTTVTQFSCQGPITPDDIKTGAFWPTVLEEEWCGEFVACPDPEEGFWEDNDEEAGGEAQ